MLFLFGVVVAPVVCRVLADQWDRYNPQRDLRAANAVCMAIAATLIVMSFPSPAEMAKQERAANPVGAVAYIRKAQLAGPMLNAYDFGVSYLDTTRTQGICRWSRGRVRLDRRVGSI